VGSLTGGQARCRSRSNTRTPPKKGDFPLGEKLPAASKFLQVAKRMIFVSVLGLHGASCVHDHQAQRKARTNVGGWVLALSLRLLQGICGRQNR
jgi:hypothetical protein